MCSIKSHTLISWCLGCIINYVNIAIQANEQESLYFSQRQYLSCWSKVCAFDILSPLLLKVVYVFLKVYVMWYKYSPVLSPPIRVFFFSHVVWGDILRYQFAYLGVQNKFFTSWLCCVRSLNMFLFIATSSCFMQSKCYVNDLCSIVSYLVL